MSVEESGYLGILLTKCFSLCARYVSVCLAMHEHEAHINNSVTSEIGMFVRRR